MTAELENVGALTHFVEDLPATKAFYVNAFARPVVHQDDSAVIDLGNTLVNLMTTSAARDLIAPAAVAGPGAGARARFTIWVQDADAACAA